jgi:hypothetical protein
MNQALTNQQQIAALISKIQFIQRTYIYALRNGEPNSYLQAIRNRQEKLMIILSFLYSIREKQKLDIWFTKVEFAENYNQSVETEKMSEAY